MSLVILLLLLAGVAVYVGAPIVRPSHTDEAQDDASLALREQRDRAFTALRELEFDHRTGKITDADYAILHAGLRHDAAAALQALAAAEEAS
jgi:hypothetical protein